MRLAQSALIRRAGDGASGYSAATAECEVQPGGRGPRSTQRRTAPMSKIGGVELSAVTNRYYATQRPVVEIRHAAVAAERSAHYGVDLAAAPSSCTSFAARRVPLLWLWAHRPHCCHGRGPTAGSAERRTAAPRAKQHSSSPARDTHRPSQAPRAPPRRRWRSRTPKATRRTASWDSKPEPRAPPTRPIEVAKTASRDVVARTHPVPQGRGEGAVRRSPGRLRPGPPRAAVRTARSRRPPA